MSKIQRSDAYWITGRTSIGFVVTTNSVGDKKLRIATVSGADEEADADLIAEYGAKVDVVDLCRWISKNSQYLIQPIVIHQGNVTGLHPDVDAVDKLRGALSVAIATARVNLEMDVIIFKPGGREMYEGLIRDWTKVLQECGGR